MRQKSLIIFLLIITLKLSNAVIKVNFELDGFNQYKATIAGQEFDFREKATKVIGKHESGWKSSDVKVIDFADKENNFTGYPPMISSIFPNAEVLLAQNSGLKLLQADALIHAAKIKMMMFAKDNFDIESAAFRHCEALEVLKFDDIDLSNINSEAFEGIPQLQILAIKKCQLVRIEAELLEPLENLIELHITENPMTKAPISAIQRMTRLTYLDLSANKLTHIHDDLFKNKNFLQTVDVSKNQIHEIERDILIHWPGHAMIDMEDNICINKRFDHIGTDSLTISDVANALMPCFKEESFITDEEESSETYEQSDEKSPNVEKEIIKEVTTQKQEKSIESIESKLSESTERRKKTLLEKLMKGKESKSRESTEEKIEKEGDNHEIIETEKNKMIEERNKKSESESEEYASSSSEEKAPKASQEKNLRNSTDVDDDHKELKVINFNKESSNSESSEEEEKTFVESSKSETKQIQDFNDTKPVMEKDDDVIDTISPYEFMDEEESAAAIEEISRKLDDIEEVGGEEKLPEVEETKKKKKVKKSKKLGSAVEAIPEVDATNDVAETSEGAVEMPEPATSFLHAYEQASCRFYIDANNKYNCVLENCTSEVKLINTDHLTGYNNSLVSGLHLRKCVLARISPIFFTTFPNLEHLSVENANIKQLDEDTVKEGCGSLKTCDLRNNKIRRVERHALQSCQHLEVMDLSGNPLEIVEGDIANVNPKLSIIWGTLKIVSPAITSFNIEN